MNLTAVSLSLLTLYSTSPLFTGNNLLIRESVFKYSISTLFFNPKAIKLQKNNFINSISPLLYLSNSNTLLENERLDFSDQNFTDSDRFLNIYPYIIIFHDCNFINYSVIKDPIIKIDKSSFYMTSCTFINCISGASPILNLNTRATTITHVCCAFTKEDDDFLFENDFFVRSEIPNKSFFQLIYSSFKDAITDRPSTHMFNFHGHGALRYQCINTTNCEMTCAFIDIDPSNLLFQMNTFNDITATYIISLNIQDGSNYGSYLDYVGYTNFIYNRLIEAAVFLDMHTGTTITFEKCVFSCMKVFTNQNSDIKPLVVECVFDCDKYINNDELELVDPIIIHNPIPLDNAHYVVPGICDGVQRENAFGCNNDECPTYVSCPPDAFSFDPSDFTYTLIFHPDINTPSPSPTESFSHSNTFSKSSQFTSSSEFSSSIKFSNSNLFPKSSQFTSSSEFSSSIKFSYSNLFSKSSQFTSSSEFTKTFEFSNSDEFSLSDCFSPTKTNVFTNSIIFTKSSEFTSSHSFTQTPTQSIYSNKITIFQSLSQSFTHVKSVSFSLSYASSIHSYECMNEDEQSSICFSNSFYFTNVPYLIVFLSKTFIPVKVSYEIQYVKKRITGEQLIGIVCGSVACLFSVLGIILFIVRKKYSIVSSDFLENSSSEIETNIQSTEKEVTFNVSEIASNNLDNWL